jgi:hypothetical protein
MHGISQKLNLRLPKQTDEAGKSSLGERANNRKNQSNNGCRVAFSGGIGQALPSERVQLGLKCGACSPKLLLFKEPAAFC